MRQTSLLGLPQYPLCASDFDPELFHKYIYQALVKLAKEGVQEATEIEIENVMKNNPAAMEVLQDNSFMDFVVTSKELCTPENYNMYYTTIRKYSLLRDMVDDGFDISEFYDGEDDESTLQKYTIQDILNAIDVKGLQLRSKYDVKYVREEMVAGQDTQQLIESFEVEPAFGAFVCSPYLTQLYRGWCRGHLIMDSSGSGVGKTRISVRDLCGVSVDTIWSDAANDFVTNPNYQGPGLFIHTELNTGTEINPMFLSCISGVNIKHITMGTLDKQEKNRVLKAGEILVRNNLVLTDMADFTMTSLDRKFKEQVENNGLAYAVFDYVQLNSAITFEYRQNTAVQSREDLVLKYITTELKDMAEKYNIGIRTSSQLNGQEKNMEFPDESCLAGGKSQKNKLDCGSITLPVKDRKKEFKRIEPYIQQKGFKAADRIKPNLITYVYKSRFGEYADQKIKVWRYFDRSRFINYDFFCTDQYDNFVNIPKPILQEDTVNEQTSNP